MILKYSMFTWVIFTLHIYNFIMQHTMILFPFLYNFLFSLELVMTFFFIGVFLTATFDPSSNLSDSVKLKIWSNIKQSVFLIFSSLFFLSPLSLFSLSLPHCCLSFFPSLCLQKVYTLLFQASSVYSFLSLLLNWSLKTTLHHYFWNVSPLSELHYPFFWSLPPLSWLSLNLLEHIFRAS